MAAFCALVEKILGGIDGLDVRHTRASQDQTKAHIAEKHERIVHVKVRHLETRYHEGGATAKKELTDYVAVAVEIATGTIVRTLTS
jgi:hypothetical protein